MKIQLPTFKSLNKRIPTVFFILMLICLVMPSGFIVQTTGEAFDVSAGANGANGANGPSGASGANGKSLVTITGTKTYPTQSTLLMTTVSSYGTASVGVPGSLAALSMFSPDRQLYPISLIYPPDTTAQAAKQRDMADMTESQDTAAIAGMQAAGLPVTMKLVIKGAPDNSPNSTAVEDGDVIHAVEYRGVRHQITSFKALQAILGTISPAATIHVDVLRHGKPMTLSLTTQKNPTDPTGYTKPGSRLGIFVAVDDVTYPAHVTYAVENIGGPSAGQMFSLAIDDALTPGSLAGNNVVAGTGTIQADGEIGVIGGIAHKMKGAADRGAHYFLAPALNCAETIGYEPNAMRIFAVRTIDDSLRALAAIKAGKTDGLTTCRDVVHQAQAYARCR